MTGVLNAVVASGGKFLYSVTIANIGGVANEYGYNDSAVPSGAISPSTFRGVTVRVAKSRSGNDNFTLTLNGPALAQSFFQYVAVQRTNNAWALYRSADAAFTPGALANIWVWGSGGADPAWTSTSPSPRAIIIAF
jgi:hypothetical protein